MLMLISHGDCPFGGLWTINDTKLQSLTPSEPQKVVNLNEKLGLADAKVRIVIKARSIFLELKLVWLPDRLTDRLNEFSY